MILSYIIAVRRNYPTGRTYSFKEAILVTKDALLGIFTAVIILGGVISGIFTATEAAGIGVLYALVVGGLIYRKLTVPLVWNLVKQTAESSASILFVIACASIFGWILWVGLSWAFFQHLLSGIRHLLMDTGWGYQLGVAKASATWTWVGSVLLTATFWGVILYGKGAF